MTEQQPGRAANISADQMPGESSRWYSRFQSYCQAGPQRSIIGIYRDSTRNPDAQLPGSWTAASTKFKWVERAKDYDRRRHEVEDAASIDALRQGAGDRQKIREGRRLLIEESEWELRHQLIARAREMLESSLFTKRATKDGKGLEMKPARWSFKTAAEMIRLACALGRASARMPAVVEAEPAGDLGAEFFESSGQLDAAMPPGALPPMPVDCSVKPPIHVERPGGKNNPPTQPEIQKPRLPGTSRTAPSQEDQRRGKWWIDEKQ